MGGGVIPVLRSFYTKQFCNSLPPAGCLTVQSYSDTNYPMLTSNCRFKDSVPNTALTSDTTPKSQVPRLSVLRLTWLQIVEFLQLPKPHPPQFKNLTRITRRTQENTSWTFTWFVLKDSIEEHPCGRAA